MENQLFKLKSKYKPSGDQKYAIEKCKNYLDNDYKYQTLWGVTGSGKTFTMANLIEKMNKPTLIIAHNKTLAAQLALEFKEFFPDNAVHYFVSYYDYYQPEAYVAKTDTYIEKEATINEEIDRLRHAATQDLLTRKDVIIVASVSCIYGIGDTALYTEQIFDLKVGDEYNMEDIIKNLIAIQFKRAGADFKPGNFQVMGDLLEIFPSSKEAVYSIEFWGNEITQITFRNYLTGEIYEYLKEVTIFPAKHTVTTKDRINEIIPHIQKELDGRLKYFKEDLGDVLRYERLKTKVEYDIEMMKEVGYVNGIENYSRYLDGRKGGESPATLLDYFGKDYLMFVDESHMTFSQIGGMYAGDRARKENLIENGFRLPSALDNRPLQFNEFEGKVNQVICVSATPSKYEIRMSCNPNIPLKAFPPKGDDDITKESKGYQKFYRFNPMKDGVWKDDEDCRIVPQVIRPTGLLDPVIELRPMEYMVDDVMKNISEVIKAGNKMLITTITKRSSEELSEYLLDNGVSAKYLHSEIDTLERLEILKELRTGEIDVIVGVNLLREGLDLPEVSKIAIIDSDKQGFLRSESALIQIIGRAARNEKGTVYMYSERMKLTPQQVMDAASVPKEEELEKKSLKKRKGEIKYTLEENNRYLGNLYRLDKGKLVNEDGLVISEAMRKAINLTYYRRGLQDEYNKKNNVTPQTIYSEIKDMGLKSNKKKRDYAVLDKKGIKKEIAKLELEMDIASANMEYEKAAEIRDRLIEIKRGK